MSETDPFQLFADWFAEARESEPNDPDAMALATATPDGRPSVRMVLLKGHGPDGFTFYTNLDSRKGAELSANARAALLFHWKSLRRQVRIEGPVEPVRGPGGGRLFRYAIAGFPARSLGVLAVAPARLARHVREADMKRWPAASTVRRCPGRRAGAGFE